MQEIKPGIYQHNLKAGPILFIVPDRQAQTLTLRYLFDTGYTAETPGKAGITNLINRLSMKKTQSFATHYQLMRTLEEDGVLIASSTNRETQVFKLHLTEPRSLPKALDTLEEIIFKPSFSQKLLEKEKDLLQQDWAQLKDTPDEWVPVISLEKLWPTSSYGQTSYGNLDMIAKLTLGDLRQYHQKLRRESQLYIGVAGKITIEEVLNLFTDRFSETSFQPGSATAEPIPTAETAFAVDTRKIQQANLWISFPAMSQKHPLYWAQKLFTYSLGIGSTSRLYDTIRTKHSLAYYYRNGYLSYRNAGAYYIYGGIPPHSLEKVFTETWKIIHAIQEKGFTKSEIRRGFNYVSGLVGRNLDQTDDRLSFYLGQLLSTGEVLTFNEWKSRLQQITMSQLIEVAQQVLRPKHASVGLVGPLGKEAIKAAWEKALTNG